MSQPSKRNIAHAFWTSEHSGILILGEDWKHPGRNLPVRLEPSGLRLECLEALTPEGAGRYFRYYRRKNSWFFAIQSKRYPELLGHKCRIFLAGDFNGWNDAIGDPQWELKPLSGEAETTYRLRVPMKRLPKADRAEFKFVTGEGQWLDAPESAPNRLVRDDGICNFVFNPAQSGRHVYEFITPSDYEPSGNEKIVWEAAGVEEVHALPHTQFLTRARSDLPMGATVEEGTTVFRLFAPRAERVFVAYGCRADASDFQRVALDPVGGNAWETRIEADLDGWFYHFHVGGAKGEGTTHFDESFPILDPYAKACLGNRGPGVIVGPKRLRKVKSQFCGPEWQDMVIMEAHVRDLAAHAPLDLDVRERQGFAGVRKWLRAEGSYLKESGINAVEFQPIQEFDNSSREDYHWGYMSVNYFSPESSYALEPESASQIDEFKGMVEDFHEAGIAVLLDVVYNHVGEPNHLLFIDKHYYFHTDEANDLVNWSGCGNDLRCDTPMARRLILESLKHLVEVYDVDGFRFDLAELIGIDVLREVEAELKAIKPSIVLVAEPWSFRGHIQDELRETGFASWNDGFREFVAAYVRGEGNQEGINYFLGGSPSTSRFAAQTINYSESHDDYAWIDRITEREERDGSDPTQLDRRRTHLMAAILFVSLGVPMIAAGQDFLRSKHGVHNTYQRGELNALDYTRRLMYVGSHEYFRQWIRFRRSSAGAALRYDGGLEKGYLKFFHVDGSSAVLMSVNDDGSRDVPQLLFGVNPHYDYATIECPLLAEAALTQVADHERFCAAGLQSALIPTSCSQIHLPPLSCGLWRVE